MTRLISKFTLLLLIAMIVFSPSYAQSLTNQSAYQVPKEVPPIRIGDEVPAITFKKVLNSEKRTLNLSELKGKLVLLDMWASFCGPCIASFPKLEGLQKEFEGKIQILLCNPHPGGNDTEEKILELLSKGEARSGFYPSLPIPIEDTILNSLFPHISLPHVVWINNQGVVVAITGSKEVNAANINAVLKNEPTKLVEKRDFLVDPQIPLYVNNNGGKEKYIYRTIITPEIDGVGSYGTIRLDSCGNVIGLFNLNVSLKELIMTGYGKQIRQRSPYTVIYDLDDQIGKGNISEKKYCYDIIVPPISPDKFKIENYLKADLDKWFNISTRLFQKKMDCYVVDISSHGKGISVSNQTSGIAEMSFDLPTKHILNAPKIMLIDALSSLLGRPIVDSIPESLKGKRFNVNFPGSLDMTDRDEVISYLRRIGFRIEPIIKEFEMLLITNK